MELLETSAHGMQVLSVPTAAHIVRLNAAKRAQRSKVDGALGSVHADAFKFES